MNRAKRAGHVEDRASKREMMVRAVKRTHARCMQCGNKLNGAGLYCRKHRPGSARHNPLAYYREVGA